MLVGIRASSRVVASARYRTGSAATIRGSHTLSVSKIINLPCRKRRRTLLRSEPRIKVENSKFTCRYSHAKMVSHEREIHRIEPRTYVLFMFELDDECNIIKKLLPIKEIMLLAAILFKTSSSTNLSSRRLLPPSGKSLVSIVLCLQRS